MEASAPAAASQSSGTSCATVGRPKPPPPRSWSSSRARARDGLTFPPSWLSGPTKGGAETVSSATLAERRCCVANLHGMTTDVVLVRRDHIAGEPANCRSGRRRVWERLVCLSSANTARTRSCGYGSPQCLPAARPAGARMRPSARVGVSGIAAICPRSRLACAVLYPPSAPRNSRETKSGQWGVANARLSAR